MKGQIEGISKRRGMVRIFAVMLVLCIYCCAQSVLLFASAENSQESSVAALPEETQTALSTASESLDDVGALREGSVAEAAAGGSTGIAALLKDKENFDISNADPRLVWLANYYAGYLGQIVVFGNWQNRRSGSFGLFIGLHENNRGNTAVLNHEHGHYEQYKQLGFWKYLFAIAIPSLKNDPVDYYSQPWEVTADLLGGVTTHYHSKGAEEKGIEYLNLVKDADVWAVIFAQIFVETFIR